MWVKSTVWGRGKPPTTFPFVSSQPVFAMLSKVWKQRFSENGSVVYASLRKGHHKYLLPFTGGRHERAQAKLPAWQYAKQCKIPPSGEKKKVEFMVSGVQPKLSDGQPNISLGCTSPFPAIHISTTFFAYREVWDSAQHTPILFIQKKEKRWLCVA